MSADNPDRSRFVSWQDPLAGPEAGRQMSGLEYVRSVFAGDLHAPPIAILMGFRGIMAGEGFSEFEGDVGEHLYNPIGVVHGGFAMTMLDSAMGCAVQTTLSQGEWYTTLETKVNFVRPITLETSKVLCTGTVIHRGRTIVTADGELRGSIGGKLLAHGTTTCLIQRPE